MSKMDSSLEETFVQMANALPDDQQPLFMALVAYRLGNKGTTHAKTLGWDVTKIRQGQHKLNREIQDDNSVTQRKALERHYRGHKTDEKVENRKKENEASEKPDLNFARAISRHGSNFSKLKAAGGNFKQSTIIGANLSEAELTGADLWNVNWSNSFLAKAKMCSVKARYSKFEHCIFRKANLSGADLTGSWFTGADLTGCDLRGANLSGTSLWGACLRDAKIDDDTILAGARITKETYELSAWNRSDLKRYYQRGLVIKDLIAFPDSVWQKLFDSSNISIAHIYVKQLDANDRKPLALAFSGLCAILAKMNQPIMVQHYVHGGEESHREAKVGYVFLLQSKSLTGLDHIKELFKQDQENFTAHLRKILPTDTAILTEEAIQKITENMSPLNTVVDHWQMKDGSVVARAETELRTFLRDAFTAQELATFIEDREEGKDILDTVCSIDAPFVTFVSEIIGAMQRRGKIDDDFFTALKRVRSRREDEVNEIQSHFRMQQAQEETKIRQRT